MVDEPRESDARPRAGQTQRRPDGTRDLGGPGALSENQMTKAGLKLKKLNRLVLGGGGGRPDDLQKLKVPEGYEKMIDYSNI